MPFSTTTLDVRLTAGNQNILLLSDLVWNDPDYTITVFTDFNTEAATLPKGIWSSLGFPFYHQFYPAAVLFDWMTRAEALEKTTVTNRLKRALLALGVPEDDATVFARIAASVNEWSEHDPLQVAADAAFGEVIVK